jgi:hypothetical protein
MKIMTEKRYRQEIQAVYSYGVAVGVAYTAVLGASLWMASKSKSNKEDAQKEKAAA